MARARIQINGVTQTAASVAIGSTVMLSNDDEGGEVSYAWTVIDQPDGSPDALSNTSIENPTFTPTKEGSYAIRLVVNQTLGTEDIQTAVVSILDARSQERFPAATETIEVSTARGWAQAVNRVLIRSMRSYAIGGGTVIAETPGGITAGKIVNFRGLAIINSGTQAQDVVSSITLAVASDPDEISDRLGVLLDGVVPAQMGAGKLVIVQTFGIPPQIVAGVPSSIGDPVFVSDAGLPSLTPGTNERRIGRVVSFSGGTFRWCIDNVGSGGVGDGSVTNVKLADMPAFTIKGNDSGVSDTPQDLTVTEVNTLLGINPAAGFGQFGDGRDGSLVMDGTNVIPGYTLSVPGVSGVYVANEEKFFTNLTINVGITVNHHSVPGPNCKGTLNNNGHVSWDGASATGIPGGGPAAIVGTLPVGSAGGSGGSSNANGGNGAASGQCPREFSTASAGGGAGAIPANPGTTGGVGHGGGGGGALSNGGNGGTVSVALLSKGSHRDYWVATRAQYTGDSAITPAQVSTGGGGGAGGGGSNGGGGGAAGSWGVIKAFKITGSGTFTSRGGNGFIGEPAVGVNQPGSGGGAGGGGGLIVIVTSTASPPTPNVAGGTGALGGAGTGTGSTGGTGAAGGPGYFQIFN